MAGGGIVPWMRPMKVAKSAMNLVGNRVVESSGTSPSGVNTSGWSWMQASGEVIRGELRQPSTLRGLS